MKLLVAYLALAGFVSAQDSITLRRTFEKGDRDTYAARFSIKIPAGDVDISLRTRQTVGKTFDNGEAELESQLLELKTQLNGESIDRASAGQSEKIVYRVDAMGRPLTEPEKSAFGFRILQYAGLLADRSLCPGESADVAWTDPQRSKRRLSGRVTLASADAKVAKLISTWEVDAENGGAPMQIAMTSFIDRASGKLERASGTITGTGGEAQVEAIQFSIERQK